MGLFSFLGDTDFLGINVIRDRAEQRANEVVDRGIDLAEQRANKLIDRGIKKLILSLLFLVLFLVGAYFGAIFAYHYFFVDVDMEPVQPEEISFEFTAVDHAYFAIRQSIVFAYDQIPCASTLLGTLFGLIFPCLLSGLLAFNGHNNNLPRRPIRQMARRPPWRW